FVDVLGSEVDAVVVIPQRAHRLVYVAGGRVGRRETGQDVWIVLVVPLRYSKEVAGEAITLGRGMAVVQVSRYRLDPKAAVIGRQVVEIPNKYWLPVLRDISLARNGAVECPQLLNRKLRMNRDVRFSLVDFIVLLRRKRCEGLMIARAALTGNGVWS